MTVLASLQSSKSCGACVQVVGFMTALCCAMIPAIVLPAWKAYTTEAGVEHRSREPGFEKTNAMWAEINNKD